jgi:DNA-binding XRE family transcriptional regulator
MVKKSKAPTFPPNRALKALRGSRSQVEAAKIAQVHNVYWCAIERGHEKLGATVAIRIAKAFDKSMKRKGISLYDLIEGNPPRA